MNQCRGVKSRTCKSLSVVIPVYNEAAVLPLLWERVKKVLGGLDCDSKVIFVDDGSTDSTLEISIGLAQTDPRVCVISLSRNFGHQAAITAGIDHADGDAVVIMDADLQDPPELIKEMIGEYEHGYDVVHAQRRKRKGESIAKKVTAHCFYRLMRMLVHRDFPVDVGDFRLMGSNVVQVLRKMRETHRFMRGMVPWVGFRQTAVLFDRDPRAAGTTKYGMIRMLRFAWSAITSFSALPIRLGIYLGLALLLLCTVYAARVLYVKFVLRTAVPGWTTIVLLQLGFSGLMFFYLGLLGDYVGRLYEEAKNRPLYIVRSVHDQGSRKREHDKDERGNGAASRAPEREL